MGIAIIAVAVAVLLWLFSSIKMVRQGYQYTIEHFGRFTTVARPGLGFYPAFFYRVGRRINMMEQVLDIPGQEIITKDNAMIQTDGVVFFQVLDSAKAAYEVSDLYVAIMQLTTTNLRTVMGSMTSTKPCPSAPRSTRAYFRSSTRRPRHGASRSRASRSRTSDRRPTSSTRWAGR